MTSTTNEKLLLEPDQPEQSDFEKISCKVHSLKEDQIFKSYRDVCIFFGFMATGGNRKKAILAELSNHCTLEKKKNSYTVIKVFDSPLPKIDEKFLSSKLYPPCGYLLLVFLAERYSQDENEKFYYLTKREIMGIISICNEYYSNAYSNYESIEEESKKYSESIYFIEKASSYLYKLTKRILDSLQSRNFIIFDKVTMIKYMGKEAHEATDEDVKIIDDYYTVIQKEYGLRDKNSIRLSKDKKKIYEKIDEHLGFKHYEAIKFNLTADLANNAEHLRTLANLSDNCGSVVNSLVCSEIYNLVFNGIAKINPHLKYECIEEYLTKKIEEFIEKGVCIFPPKYIKQWHFNFDVNVVISRIESLTRLFIRVDA